MNRGALVNRFRSGSRHSTIHCWRNGGAKIERHQRVTHGLKISTLSCLASSGDIRAISESIDDFDFLGVESRQIMTYKHTCFDYMTSRPGTRTVVDVVSCILEYLIISYLILAWVHC